MGKSATKMVLAMHEPVIPKTGKDGIRQPPYNRSKHVIRVSEKVIRLNNCIAQKLKGKVTDPKSRLTARKQFAEAAHKCATGEATTA